MTPRLYIAAAAVSGLLVAGAAFWWQAQRIKTLRAETASLRLSVDACNERTKNIIEDRSSDDEVDRIPDRNLRRVPDRWLLEPGAGGIY